MSETAKPYSNLEIANIFELGAETIRGQMATIENLQAQLREAKTDISCLESKITVERRAGEAAVAQLREKTDEIERLRGSVEAAALGEAVIDALYGNPVSDFYQSMEPVRLAMELCKEVERLTSAVLAFEDATGWSADQVLKSVKSSL